MRDFFGKQPGVINRETGFTLVELMIALFISGMVMTTFVSVYTAQTKSYVQHDEVAELQQNLRGILAVLSMEIRLAGCDPTQSSKAKFLVAKTNELNFTSDFRGDSSNGSDGDVNDTDENIAYTLRAKNNKTDSTATADSDGDGIIDTGGTAWNYGDNITPYLGRQTGGAGGYQPLVNNIEALEFNYILKDGSTSSAPNNLNNIRAVQVTLLARTSMPDQNFTHNATYTTASGTNWTPPNDHYRRRMAILTIKCRNMGL